MIPYSPLGDFESKSLWGFPLRDAYRYIFLAGIIFNVIVSVYLFSWTSFWLHNPSNTESKYEGLSRHNFEQYLDVANLDFLNSSALFNEVENAVKQKNADLNPIGVSYFPAYIPEGTFLYHSNGDGLIPTSLEWVAMDYEFSYDFAHFPRPNRFGRHGPYRGPHKGPHKGPPPPNGGPPEFLFKGSYIPHLLTFKVTRPLDKLIYLGGASAAKTSTGEMDTQFLLSQMDNYDDFNERRGAERICKWGNSQGRKLDGVVRLEIGFEIIICDFDDKLELIQNLTLTLPTDIVGFPEELPVKEDEEERKHDQEKTLSKRTVEEDEDKQRSKVIDIFENMSGYEHYAAGEYVYDGDPRIHLDFSKLITLVNRTYISADTYSRRIDKIAEDVNATFLKDMNNLLSGPEFDPYSSTNWEVATHRIVKKFTPILMVLNQTITAYLESYDPGLNVSEKVENLEMLSHQLTAYTYNFVRRYSDKYYEIDSDEQIKDSISMLIWDYTHPYQSLKSDSDFLIWASITNVHKQIIEQVYGLFNLGKEILVAKYVNKDESKLLEVDLHESIKNNATMLNDFIDNLNWSIFYRCSQVCQYNEICFVPTWGPSPLGWGVNERLKTHHKTDDGILRINKDLICLSQQELLDAGNDF